MTKNAAVKKQAKVTKPAKRKPGLAKGTILGSRIGSDRWKIEQLKKGEQLCFMGKDSVNISSILSKADMTGRYSTERCLVTVGSKYAVRGTVVTRHK